MESGSIVESAAHGNLPKGHSTTPPESLLEAAVLSRPLVHRRLRAKTISLQAGRFAHVHDHEGTRICDDRHRWLASLSDAVFTFSCAAYAAGLSALPSAIELICRLIRSNKTSRVSTAVAPRWVTMLFDADWEQPWQFQFLRQICRTYPRLAIRRPCHPPLPAARPAGLIALGDRAAHAKFLP